MIRGRQGPAGAGVWRAGCHHRLRWGDGEGLWIPVSPGYESGARRAKTTTYIDNRPLFDSLLAEGKIRMQRAPVLDTAPAPLPAWFTFDRVEGMLLGLAIGDSLGNTTESQLPAVR